MYHISTQVEYFDSIEGEEESKVSYNNLYCYSLEDFPYVSSSSVLFSHLHLTTI
jgi:hypothetical protein